MKKAALLLVVLGGLIALCIGAVIYPSTGSFSGVISGNGSGLTNVTSLTMTNFISGRFYTNVAIANQLIRCACTLTTTGVVGRAEMDIVSGNTIGGATITASAVLLTTNTTFNANNFMDLTTVVTNGQVYAFTNQSTGVGNVSTLVSGSGQILTMP